MSYTIFSHCLVIKLHAFPHVFATLIDTGANVSFIDNQLVQYLNIDTYPMAGAIELASINMQVPCIGRTIPLHFTPYLMRTHLKQLPCREHSFELMDLPRHRYQFIIGTDLIKVMFPTSIPTRICVRQHQHNHVTMVQAIQSELLHGSKPPLLEYNSSEAPINSLSINELEGLGSLPPEEEPIRSKTSTSSELETSYTNKRNELLSSPDIQQALKYNENIKGVCNLPEAQLQFKLDPIKGKPEYINRGRYNIPTAIKETANLIVQRWIKEGKVVKAPVGCPYNNPVVVAPKKDDQGNWTGIRVCLDLRRVNEALIDVDVFEIPRIKTIFESLQGCSIFGEFDLAEAYLQLPLHPESQPFTAFQWEDSDGHINQYMFVVVPFGIKMAPSHFQRLMGIVFSGYSFTYPYFDNIPFASRTWNEHHIHVLTILTRLNECNLRVKAHSFKVGQSQLSCLGHLINGSGVTIAPDKMAKIIDWPLPVTGKQLASFIGLITFVRQYIRHFSDLTWELETLKKIKGNIQWTPRAIESFNMIKHAISKAPLLKFPDLNQPFYIATDASCVGIGGVLYQPTHADDDIHEDNIIAICSKKLSDTQRRYSAYKKELFGVIYCLRQFHSYIWGHHKLVIVTDHMPLTHILTSPSLAHALQQWLDVILDYYFTVKHRPGLLHVLPDALSRMYEATYTSAWGIPKKDPHDVIQQLQLPTDTSITHEPDPPPKYRHARSICLYNPSDYDESYDIDPWQKEISVVSDDDIDSEESDYDVDIDLMNDNQDSHSEDSTEDEKDTIPHPIPHDPTGRLLVRPSVIKGAGLGVFTGSSGSYRKNEFICEYEGELISLDEYNRRYPEHKSECVFAISKDWYIDAISSYRTWGRYINTNPGHNNVKARVDTRHKRIRLYASKRIGPNQELYVPYGIGQTKHKKNQYQVQQQVAASEVEPASHDEPLEIDMESKYDTSSDVSQLPSLSVQERNLLYEMERRGMIIPSTDQEKLNHIDRVHQQGHFGRDHIATQLMRERIWWPGLRNAIQDRINMCEPCMFNTIKRKGFDPITPIQASLPWDAIQLDASTGWPKTDDGMTSYLLYICVCTGFCLLRAVPNIQETTVAMISYQIFNDFGFPKFLQTDNGPEFHNRLIQEICNIGNLQHHTTTPYHPRANGLVEKHIGITSDMIRKLLYGTGKQWSMFLPFIQSAINNRIRTTTGSTPFSLMFGRRYNPFKDYSSEQIVPPATDAELNDLHQRMIDVIFPAISERVSIYKDKMSTRINKSRRLHNYRKGDIVMLLRTEVDMNQPLNKIATKYTGPYQVVHKGRNGVIHLMSPSGTMYPMNVRAHRLKYVGRHHPNFNQAYEVEKILNHRGSEANREYLVRWQGYGPESDEWIPEIDFHTHEVIDDYWDTLQVPAAPLSSSSSDDSSIPMES